MRTRQNTQKKKAKERKQNGELDGDRDGRNYKVDWSSF